MAKHITYDPEADAIAIVFSPGPSEAEEVYPGVILHFDDRYRIVEIEILSASTKFATGALDGRPLPGEPEKVTVRVPQQQSASTSTLNGTPRPVCGGVRTTNCRQRPRLRPRKACSPEASTSPPRSNWLQRSATTR